MKRRILAASAAVALLFSGPAFAQGTTIEPSTSDSNDFPTSPTTQDTQSDVGLVEGAEEFAAMAANSNMFEIVSSELALQRSQNSAVQEFAQQMVSDHTQAGETMMQAAAEEGITDLPQSLDARHQAMVTQLEEAPEGEFDAEYINMQTAAHQEAVTLFGNYAQQEGPLADFAEATLPTLEQHLATVQGLTQAQ